MIDMQFDEAMLSFYLVSYLVECKPEFVPG